MNHGLPGFSPITRVSGAEVTKVHGENIHYWDVAAIGSRRYQGCVDGPPSGSPFETPDPVMNATSYRVAYAETRYSVTACFHDHQTIHSAAACIHSAGGYVVAVEYGVLRALSDAEEVEFQKAMRGRALPSVAGDYDYLFRANRGLLKPS